MSLLETQPAAARAAAPAAVAATMRESAVIAVRSPSAAR